MRLLWNVSLLFVVIFQLNEMLSQSHLTEVGATLCEYRRQNFLCDTELCTSNNKLKAHSVLLAAVSPVFKSVFEMSGAAGMYCINLPGIGSEELEIALHFIYTGTLLLPLCYRLPGELSRLFVLMEQLGLDSQKFDGCEMTFKRFWTCCCNKMTQ